MKSVTAKRGVLLPILIFVLFAFNIFDRSVFAYADPNSYKCSRGEYQDCIIDGSCWGGCGRSPTSEGLMSVCPTGYRCFCETDTHNTDGFPDECRCVECTSGCKDPFGYYSDTEACPGPTCESSGHKCLPWGDSGCSTFNPTTFSCSWYSEACCTKLNNNYNCLGNCNSPGRMLPFPANFDSNDESTYCPDGYKYKNESDYGRLCVEKDKNDNIIGGSACCVPDKPCPGLCSVKCPPSSRPELDGISLEYTCDSGLLCCVENTVKPTCPITRGSCINSPSGRCPSGYSYLAHFDCSTFGDDLICCVEDLKPPKDAAYRGPLIDSLDKILGPIVKILYYGGLMIGIFYIILSGYRLMVSQGNPQQTQDAQEQLTAAILGIIFILLSVTILRIILGKVIGITV